MIDLTAKIRTAAYEPQQSAKRAAQPVEQLTRSLLTDTGNKTASTVQLSAQAKESPSKVDDFQLGKILNRDIARATTANESDKTSQLIENLKEKIRAVTDRISELKGNEDETTEDQLKMLQAELASLNAQLLALVNEQLIDLNV